MVKTVVQKKPKLVNKEAEKYIWLLFLTVPVLAFVLALRYYKYKNLRKFILFFGGLYGLTFVPIPNSDATRYAFYYSIHTYYTFQDYLFDISNIFSETNSFPDIYIYTLFYVGNLVTNNEQFFFFITGLIYFYVFSKLLNSFYDMDYQILKKVNGFFFLGIVFILIFSAGISGVRWPLGLIVFLYGAYNLITQNEIKYYFIAVASILCHFSLAAAVGALTLYYFVPFIRKPKFLILFAIFSFVAGSLFTSIIFGNADALGEVASSKLEDYTREGYVTKRASRQVNWNWYVPIAHYGVYYFSIAATLFMWVMQSKFKTNKITTNLLSFVSLMISVSFIAGGVVDAMTNRYTLIVNFAAMAYLVYMGFLNPDSRRLKILKYIFAPIILIKALVVLRTDLQTVSLFLITNPLLKLFF